jgi:hypothetical protein
MKSYFSIEDVTVLKNGKIIVAGSLRGGDVKIDMIGSAVKGKSRIKIISVALINSPPAAADKRALHVQLLAGEISELNGSLIEFDS